MAQKCGGEGKQLCRRAGVDNFVAFLHDPDHSDTMLTEAQRAFDSSGPPSGVVAYEGLKLTV